MSFLFLHSSGCCHPYRLSSSLLSEPWRTLYGSTNVGVVEAFGGFIRHPDRTRTYHRCLFLGSRDYPYRWCFYFRKMERTFADSSTESVERYALCACCFIMSDTVIKVEGLGKLYRIGSRQNDYRTLRDTITDASLPLSSNQTNFKL